MSDWRANCEEPSEAVCGTARDDFAAEDDEEAAAAKEDESRRSGDGEVGDSARGFAAELFDDCCC